MFDPEPFVSFASDLIAGTLGAGFGAYAAFALERSRRDREQVSAEVLAGNIALVTLINMHGALRHIQRAVDEHRSHPLPWLAISPVPNEATERYVFDLPSLGFLTASADLNVLNDLVLTERRFRASMQASAERTRAVYDMLIPAMDRALPPRVPGSLMVESPQEIEDLLPDRVVGMMRVTTAAMIQSVDENVRNVETMYAALRAALKSVHPRQRFYAVEFDTAARQ